MNKRYLTFVYDQQRKEMMRYIKNKYQRLMLRNTEVYRSIS